MKLLVGNSTVHSGALYISTVQYVHIYACLKSILTLLALVLPVAQWLEHPNYN